MEALRTADIVELARELGWAAAGVASLAPFDRAAELSHTAIAEGRLAGMPWLSHERVDAAADIGERYPWARSLISLAWSYRPAPATPASTPGRPRGRAAAYAMLPSEGHAVDYHDLLGERCRELCAAIAKRSPGARAKWFVDHGWAMDKPIAERAGIGFAGKNTTLITEVAGSYVLLAEVLTSVDLAPTASSARNCGTCQACLPACPTGALLAPGVMDANRCISYLTIEHRGTIPETIRPLMGTWIFGCDLCQEACPINQRLAPRALAAGEPGTVSGPVPFPDLVECLKLDDAEFETRFRGTAVWRTGRAGLARNAAIALGNAADPLALPALRQAAAADPDEVVRESATWAVGRLESAALNQ
jgi:epoxyqueuosine reductase